MRIGLNLLHAQPEIGGVWNYVARLVRALGQYEDTNHYVAFVTDRSSCLVPNSPAFEMVRVNIDPVSRLRRVLYENSVLQISARNYRLDLIHWFANTHALYNTVPSAISLYDMLPFENPGSFGLAKRVYLKTMLRHTVRNNPLFLPMSHSTLERAHRILNIGRSQMVVIPAIIDYRFQPVEDHKLSDFQKKHNLPETFWLYVAHLYPHKNHLRLLEAYSILKSNGFAPWPLVLRGDRYGAHCDVMDRVYQLSLENHVISLPRLEEEELPLLYSASTALVFPSLYEGGAIPVMEAMACGCPVIASDIPPMREFGKNAITLFDPYNTASIASSMKNFQEDLSLRLESRRMGIEKVADSRPDRVARKLLEAYRKVLL